MRENHILIIDDDLMLLKTAEEILSDQYNVSVATVSYTHLDVYKRQCLRRLFQNFIEISDAIKIINLKFPDKYSDCQVRSQSQIFQDYDKSGSFLK